MTKYIDYENIQEQGIYNNSLSNGINNDTGNNIPGVNTPKLTPTLSIKENLAQSNLVGWVNTVNFASTVYNIVTWGTGTISLANGLTWNITSGTTGTMSAVTYIYLDTSVSLTELQTTTTPQNSVGPTKLLVAVAKQTEVGKSASFQVFGTNNQGVFITADNIASNTITGNEIVGNTLSAITADLGSITAGQIVVGSTNKFWFNEGSDGVLAMGGTNKATAPFRVTADGILNCTGANIDGQIVVGTTNKMWFNEGGDGRLAVGGAVKTNAPFFVDSNGDARSNTLTNKSIFFETTTAPSTTDGQLFCNTNGGSGKVLWGYFGADSTKQQISMSRMQTAGSFDRTANQTITVSTWFQPRLLIFNGFFENTTTGYYGTTNGQAGSVTSANGFCNCSQFFFSSLSNVVSGLSLGTKSNVVSDLSFTTSPANERFMIDSDADGVYDMYRTGLPIGWTWNNNTVVDSYSWSNNAFSFISTISMASNVNSFGANKPSSPDVRAYVSSWSDTGLTIEVVVGTNWRLVGNYTIFG